MGSLNPNIVSDELAVLLNQAVEVSRRYMRKNLGTEMVLYVMLQEPGTAAFRLLQDFSARRGTDLKRLEQKVRLAMEARYPKDGDMDYMLPDGKKFALSHHMLTALDHGLSFAENVGDVYINSDHLLAGMTHPNVGASDILQKNGITHNAMQELFAPQNQSTAPSRRESSTLKDFVSLARTGDLRGLYFRKTLLRDMISMLSQSVQRHIVLLGPDGVGKRSLAQSLAFLIVEGRGPVGLDKLIQIEERAFLDSSVEAMQSGIRYAKGGILFIPHLHRFFGGQLKAEFPKAGQNLQKAFLDYDPVIIATTTATEWDGRISKVNAIVEHAQVLTVPEPDAEEALEILKEIRSHIAGDYDIDVHVNAMPAAVDMARRYMSGVPLPRSAEHLLHRAAAIVSMNNQQQIAFKAELSDDVLDSEDITLAVARITGIPVNKLDQDERSRYAQMVEHLHERIIGQDDAVLAVSRAVKTARVGLKDPRRPIGSFLFLGPSGVGKTELARALAEFMFDDENALLQIDMSEYMEENTISRLIGAPPGYVGYEGGGQLTDRVREQPYIVVLFDEVEKAHSRILDILLQVLEEGRLTDSRGRPANFSESVVILTCNLGAQHLQTPVIDEDAKEAVLSDVRKHFRPEFVNRLDDVVVFHPLSQDNLFDILNLMLQQEIALGAESGLNLTFTESAAQWMLEQNDQPEYGARPLRRIIQRYVRDRLADFVLKGNLATDDLIYIDADENGLIFDIQSA